MLPKQLPVLTWLAGAVDALAESGYFEMKAVGSRCVPICKIAGIFVNANFGRNQAMKVMIDLCIVPLGVGVSLSPYVAACEKILVEAGLKTALHAYGTNVEGEWDTVLAAVRRCHEVVHGMGAPRITTTIKLGTRTDRMQSMEDKVRSVQEKL